MACSPDPRDIWSPTGTSSLDSLPFAVAILGEDRLAYIWPGQEVGKNGIHNPGNVFKYISPIDKKVVVGC